MPLHVADLLRQAGRLENAGASKCGCWGSRPAAVVNLLGLADVAASLLELKAGGRRESAGAGRCGCKSAGAQGRRQA